MQVWMCLHLVTFIWNVCLRFPFTLLINKMYALIIFEIKNDDNIVFSILLNYYSIGIVTHKYFCSSL